MHLNLSIMVVGMREGLQRFGFTTAAHCDCDIVVAAVIAEKARSPRSGLASALRPSTCTSSLLGRMHLSKVPLNLDAYAQTAPESPATKDGVRDIDRTLLSASSLQGAITSVER